MTTAVICISDGEIVRFSEPLRVVLHLHGFFLTDRITFELTTLLKMTMLIPGNTEETDNASLKY